MEPLRNSVGLVVHDPRTLCNLILQEWNSWSAPRPVLAKLQRLLYFANGIYLIETGTPLLFGWFEAWQTGPVNSVVQQSFADAGDGPVTFYGMAFDPFTAQPTPSRPCEDVRAIGIVRRVVQQHRDTSLAHLNAIACARKGPWHETVEIAKTRCVLGMRISEELIRSRFKYHKAALPSEHKRAANRDKPWG